MADKAPSQNDIFVTLNDLVRREYSARFLSFVPRRHRVNTSLTGKHASKLRGRGLDFEEVRLYVRGDDIRDIDWKVTARTQKTHTRVYTEEKEKPVLVIVDQTKAMFFGSVKRTKSVVAAELAATVAFKVLKNGDRIGGVVFADNGIDIVAPKRDRKNLMFFLHRLAKRNQELEHSTPVVFQDGLTEAIKRVNDVVSHDYLVIVISDFHRSSPGFVKAIFEIALHNDVALFKISDPLEESLPEIRFIAGNRDTQIAINGKEKAIRDKYDKGTASDYADFRDKMRDHGIPVVKIDTVNPLDLQLKDSYKQLDTSKL